MNTRSYVSIGAMVLVALVLLAGCATTNADGSPKWTTDVPSHWRTYHAVGYGKLSNVQNSRMRAEAMATDAVARWASVTVQGALTNYFQDSGSSGNQNLEMLESISRQVVDISLRGIQVEEQYTDADGGVWVLVSFPVKNLKDAYKAQSLKLEREAQIGKADLLIEYLERELAKEGK
ncbi:MAG: LPP20 family lipoprotein [Sphaerochaetaceae bacterium]|jgi:hypothetical protein|nr:LPP20 family lipoprotein [Sphaerochaetaceae bacterium]MDD3941464.1 LPP20 family lipoprotein [Sphaerochaetaceae bacterium]MDX9938775.1 LPP20 family lipoprotein [Sphaerochaetaceae bacterium]